MRVALYDWPMTMIGYPEHTRSGVRVVGLTHASTHEALRFAEAVGLGRGWLVSQGPSPHLNDIPPDVPVPVTLPGFFLEGRLACTEGVVSGSITYVATTAEDGPPPDDRAITVWSESRGRPWMQVVDNEVAWFGGLDDAALDGLLRLYLCRRPLDLDWQTTRLGRGVLGRLKAHLFAHGLTRNCSLVFVDRKAEVDLWAGVHNRCVLPIQGHEHLQGAQVGLRLALDGKTWQCRDLEGECPLDDERGRVAPPL